jgi:hypothetical protein
MRACATVNVLVLAGSLAATVIVACTGGSPPPVPPPAATDAPAPTSAATTAPTALPPASTTSAAAAASAAPSDAGAPRAHTPASARDCRDLASEITNEPPDRGVVMNNALTAADAGASDRLRPVVDVLKSKRDAFRCCFDLWAKGHPGEAGRVALHLELAPDGKLEKVDVKKDESTVRAEDLDACMLDVATSLAYPRSPSGKRTEVTYPFEFKARR